MKIQILRKLFVSFGIISTFGLTLATAISCGSKSKSNSIKKPNPIKYKVGDIKPLDFNAIFKNDAYKKSEPLFYRGINYVAYAQGLSFILNVLRGLGWNWEDTSKVSRLYDDSFNFDAINPINNKASKMDKVNSDTSLEQKLQNDFRDNYIKGLAQFIEKNTNSKQLVSSVYNQIKSLVFVRKGINVEKVDATTEVVINLGNDFTDLTYGAKLKRIANEINQKWVAKKIFQDKKYAYTWAGNSLNKLGFQIQEQNPTGFRNILILWHYSDEIPQLTQNLSKIRQNTSNFKALIRKTPLLVSARKNLSQVSFDPFGFDGTMSHRIFFTNLNVKHTSSYKEYSNFYKSPPFNNPKTRLELWVSRIYSGGGKFRWTFYKTGDKLSHTIASYISFVDGKNPGTTILKMFGGVAPTLTSQSLSDYYPLQTMQTPNRIQTFYQVENEDKLKQIAKLIFKFIKFLKKQEEQNSTTFATIRKAMPPPIKLALEFIKNNEITEQDILDQVKELNNGSHYMIGVEIFLRGMINVPSQLLTNFEVPTGIKLFLSLQGDKYQRMKNEIVGMANVNSIIPIIFLAYSANRANTDKISHFDPKTSDYQTPTTWEASFFNDLSSLRKSGKEIPFYPS